MESVYTIPEKDAMQEKINRKLKQEIGDKLSESERHWLSLGVVNTIYTPPLYHYQDTVTDLLYELEGWFPLDNISKTLKVRMVNLLREQAGDLRDAESRGF